MDETNRAMRRLALQVLDLEAKGSQNPQDIAEAAGTACEKLHRQVASLIGPAGFDSLFARAFNLAKAKQPFLKEVQAGAQGRLKWLPESVQARSATEVRVGLAEILASFFWLLTTFIGEGLTLRQIAKTWPEFSAAEWGPASEEEKE